jgi:MFS family permease
MGEAEQVGNVDTRPSRRGLTIGLLICVVAIAFEAMAVLTAMPAAAKDLGDVDLYAWAFTAFGLAQTSAIAAAGQFSDRVGPKAPMMVGFVVFAVGLVVAGSAPTMPMLLLGRFIQGLGGGTMNLAVMVLVARVFDEQERARMLTGFSAAWMGPSFLGPPIAAWLTVNASWHWVFWSVLPVLLIAGALIVRPLLRAELPPHEEVPVNKRQLWSAALVALGAMGVQLAGQRIEWWSLPWLVGGLALLWFGLPVLLPAGFRFSGRGLDAVIGTRAAISAGYAGAQSFLPLMLVQAEGFSLQTAGIFITTGSVGWMAGAWLQSQPWLRLRRDLIITVGAGSTAGGLAALAVAGWLPGRLVPLSVAGWVLAGLGMGLAVASTSLAVMQLSSPVEIGRNTSSLQVGEALGAGIGAGLAGTMFVLGSSQGNPTLGFGGLLTVMAVLGLLSLAAAVRVGAVENHSVTL